VCGGRGKGGRGGACGVEGEEFCSQESHVESVVQRCAVLVAGDAPKREVQLLGCALLIAPIADDDVGAFASETRHDPLETALLPDFGGAVDIIDGENAAQSVEDDFGQCRHKLRRRHQNVDAVGP